LEEQEIKKIISGNIKRLIKEQDIKIKDFADKVGVKESVVSKYKSGDNFFPLLKVPIITETLNCTINDIFSPIFDDIEIDKEILEITSNLKMIKTSDEHWPTMKKIIQLCYQAVKDRERLPKKRDIKD